ncbi:MAG: DUF2293 domain-containing protein [Bradymonadia bacterium]
MKHETVIVTTVPDPRFVRGPDGKVTRPPEGWVLVKPGDPALTRRLKTTGPSWTVQEKKGRKTFSRGLWAPQENVARIQKALETERASPAYARKRASDTARRQREQVAYVQTFERAVLKWLDFNDHYAPLAQRMAKAIAEHATPVGSGTVARTQRIPLEARVEAAVIAWMRHQTTAYDNLMIPRVKGMRREVRQKLARASRRLLAKHRDDARCIPSECPLCKALPAD